MDSSVGLSPWTCDLKFLYVSNECRIGLLNLQPSLKFEFNGLKELETFCLRYEITSQLYGVYLRASVWSKSDFLSSVSCVGLGLLS